MTVLARVFLLSVLLPHLALSQVSGNDSALPRAGVGNTGYDYETYTLIYYNEPLQTLTCSVTGIDELAFQKKFPGEEDCMIFMYLNDERVVNVPAKTTSYKMELKGLTTKVRCDATCENNSYKDFNVKGDELTIQNAQKMNLIYILGGGGGGLLLLIIILVIVIVKCRHRIPCCQGSGQQEVKVKKQKLPLSVKDVELEYDHGSVVQSEASTTKTPAKPKQVVSPKPLMSPKPAIPPKPVMFSPLNKSGAFNKELEARLNVKSNPKQQESESESETDDEDLELRDNMPTEMPNFNNNPRQYNLGYNPDPSRYRYSELCSDI